MENPSSEHSKISIEIRLIENAKTLKASAKVTLQTEIGEATASGFRIIEKDAGMPWVGFPQETYQRDDRTWVNIPMLEFAPRGRRIIAEIILAEYRKLKPESPSPSQIPARPQKA
jgi:DNA-binding cell septation regulator SpoVG